MEMDGMKLDQLISRKSFMSSHLRKEFRQERSETKLYCVKNGSDRQQYRTIINQAPY